MSRTFAKSAASDAVRSPAATPATIVSAAATLSAGVSIGGNSTSTGPSLRVGASRSMQMRIAAISPFSANSIS
ncbi:MAG TPA: hypothetical protein VE801_00870, partial [Xanthobacteraceae bacterium]|nr:hypothetical protein [Xanthobacteraceae bacterium]